MALRTRHNAAMEIVRRGIDLDGELLLSYVIWPTRQLEQVSASVTPTRRGARPGVRRTTVGRQTVN